MPLTITDLKPGDRVVLNCPKARTAQHKEAQFEGVFRSFQEMIKVGTADLTVISEPTVEYLQSERLWARFRMFTGASWELLAGFAVNPDGSLRDDEGRRITIERRSRMQAG